jgi:hypothetical protein
MNREQSFDVKNLSSRKLCELLSTESRRDLSNLQQQLAMQELVLRRHYLEQQGNLHAASGPHQQQFYHH